MRATTDELNVFIRVVESGSFSRAAEQLQMANSAVSRSVKKLESKLGVTLLTRTTRQLALTQEGERYFLRVQELMQSLSAVENELVESHHTPRGLLRIDAATPVILHLITPMIKSFCESYPDITVSLSSSESFINLIERKVDIAIRVGNLNDSGLRARFLFNSFRKIIATPAYLKQFGTPLKVSDLHQHMCLNFVDIPQLNRWPVNDDNGEFYYIEPGLSANSGETVKKLCLEGNGIACLSDFMVDKEIGEGTFTELLPEHIQPVEMPFNAVYYSESGVSQRIRVFIDFLSEWIAVHIPKK